MARTIQTGCSPTESPTILGLITVMGAVAEVRCDPGPYRPRKSPAAGRKLLKEFARLEGDQVAAVPEDRKNPVAGGEDEVLVLRTVGTGAIVLRAPVGVVDHDRQPVRSGARVVAVSDLASGFSVWAGAGSGLPGCPGERDAFVSVPASLPWPGG